MGDQFENVEKELIAVYRGCVVGRVRHQSATIRSSKQVAFTASYHINSSPIEPCPSSMQPTTLVQACDGGAGGCVSLLLALQELTLTPVDAGC